MSIWRYDGFSFSEKEEVKESTMLAVPGLCS